MTINGGGIRGVVRHGPGGLARHDGLPSDVQQLTAVRPCEELGDVVLLVTSVV